MTSSDVAYGDAGRDDSVSRALDPDGEAADLDLDVLTERLIAAHDELHRRLTGPAG